ncbi:hypothetical protein HRI_000575500 [Hibiscus trionum]|uniref:Rapid ALkalinization Factor n=1 Tax=Hibiscus trionum TaxID=183268 RepID=A0A9W7LLL9_HIBTR|nr:hypothetical protein HRI_000575500 [Hibiscus trionum]
MGAKMMKRNLSLAILVLVFYNSMKPSGGMWVETNGSSWIVTDHEALEFLMDSHSSRILMNGGPGTGGTGNPNAPVANCERTMPYYTCLPDANRPGPPPENPGLYNRGRL